MSPADVLVVGAGPAGSTVAGLLAARGVDVLVVDRATFPRPKPCGECVNPGAVAALERLGLLDAVLALDPAPLDGWRVRGAGVEAGGAFGRELQGLGVARADFDHALLRTALARGARLREGVRVEDVTPARGPDRPVVRLRQGDRIETLQPRLVVGADGLRSRVAAALGRVPRPPRVRKASLTFRLRWPGGPAGRGLLSVRDGVTLGVAPVRASEPLWNATLVVDTEQSRSGAARLGREPRAFLGELMAERLDGPGPFEVLGGPWASGPFDRPVPRPWAPGVVLVGDAAGYYDPFTGQGIYRALRSAELAAQAISEALGVLGALGLSATPTVAGEAAAAWAPLERYARAWTRETRSSRALQRAVEAVMARPFLRDRILPRLDGAAGLNRIVRVTGDAAPVSLLLNPAWWMPVLIAPAGSRATTRARRDDAPTQDAPTC